MKKKITSILLTILFGGILYYISLPAINFTNIGFYMYIFMILIFYYFIDLTLNFNLILLKLSYKSNVWVITASLFKEIYLTLVTLSFATIFSL